MNPLDQHPEIRRYLYIVQWVVNGILTVAGAYFLIDGTAIEDLPKWYVIAVGVAPVLWTYLGITAQTNVTPNDDGKDGTVLVEDTPLADDGYPPSSPPLPPADPPPPTP